MVKKFSQNSRWALQGLLAVVVLSAFVCTTNQQVKAAKFADAYAKSLKSMHEALNTALVSGRLTPAEHTAALTALLRANEAGLHLNAAIRGVARGENTGAAVLAALDEAEKAVNDGTAAVKNPETKALIDALAAAVKLSLQQIAQLYQPPGAAK